MNLNQSIPEDLVPEVLETASRLYQEQKTGDDYSLAELMAAGSEVALPPELIQQAYQQLQNEKRAAADRKVQRQQQLKIGGAVAAVFSVLCGLYTVGAYNKLSAAETEIAGKWAQVENQMQRRADLIPQLTQIANAYADREGQMMMSLESARASFLNAETVAERSAADEEVKSAIAQFQTFAASNQQLQSNQLFVNLQYEIAGTENRIATERMRYNQSVEQYNQTVKRFPTALIAGTLGFESQVFLGER